MEKLPWHLTNALASDHLRSKLTVSERPIITNDLLRDAVQMAIERRREDRLYAASDALVGWREWGRTIFIMAR